MRNRSLIWTIFLSLAVFAFASAQESRAPATGSRPGGTAQLLEIKGPIGPATSRFIEKGLQSAQEQNSQLVILQIDTPGGLDTAMRDIIRAILASPIPVVVYVAPPGARAASAGAYILYASHVAAMAPATNVGAATPVSIGGEQPRERPRPRDAEDEDANEPASQPEADRNIERTRDGAGSHTDRASKRANDSAQEGTPQAAKERDRADGSTEDAAREGAPASSPNRPRDGIERTPPTPDTAMERKVVNDSVAYIRSLAELRKRNADWAEQAVRSAASLSSTAALKMNVIEIIARDLDDLLTQLNGREVKVGERTVTLNTTGIVVERIEPDWRTQLLFTLTNPTIAYGLLLIGIYGLLLEGYNPGAIVPGVVGAISLLMALFAFQILSVNYAGLALIGLGVAMIIAEVFVPSFGALGLGGLVAFVIGSIILLDTDVPGLDIATPLIAGVATAGGLVVLGIAFLVGRSARKPVTSGVQTMLGATAEVVEDFDRQGLVRVGGELWNAHTSVPLVRGQQVRIVKVEGLSVWVEQL